MIIRNTDKIDRRQSIDTTTDWHRRWLQTVDTTYDRQDNTDQSNEPLEFSKEQNNAPHRNVRSFKNV